MVIPGSGAHRHALILEINPHHPLVLKRKAEADAARCDDLAAFRLCTKRARLPPVWRVVCPQGFRYSIAFRDYRGGKK
jgi:hypothetical protein